MHRERFYTLSASCPDRVGIVAKVSGFFAGHGGWILETSLHAERPDNGDGTGRYFMRVEIKADSLPFHLAELRERFRPLAEELAMDWKITDSAVKKRVVLLVSKQEHCLYDLLARWQSRDSKAGTCVSCHASHITGSNAQSGFMDSQTVRAECDACHAVLRREEGGG